MLCSIKHGGGKTRIEIKEKQVVLFGRSSIIKTRKGLLDGGGLVRGEKHMGADGNEAKT